MSISQTFGSKYRTPLTSGFDEWQYSLTNGATYPDLALTNGAPVDFYPENAGSFTLDIGVYCISGRVVLEDILPNPPGNYTTIFNLLVQKPSQVPFFVPVNNAVGVNDSEFAFSCTYAIIENATLMKPTIAIANETGDITANVKYVANGSSFKIYKIL